MIRKEVQLYSPPSPSFLTWDHVSIRSASIQLLLFLITHSRAVKDKHGKERRKAKDDIYYIRKRWRTELGYFDREAKRLAKEHEPAV